MKVKECKDLNPQLFPVSSQSRVESRVEARVGFGLDFTWCEAAESFYGYFQIPNYTLSWRGDGEVESCSRGAIIETGFPPQVSVQFAYWRPAL